METVIEDDNLIIRPEAGETTKGLVCSLRSIAVWQQLLGTRSPTETVAMMMQAQDPGIINRATGENAWTSAYTQLERDRLQDLNQTRKAALHRATNPRTRALSIDGRETTRRLLGLPGNPIDTYEATAALATGQTEDEEAMDVPLPDGIDETTLTILLDGQAPLLEQEGTAFLESLVRITTDPQPQP
ncbi:hypothetical protein [Bifidobacterium vansinderenii]|uniref:Uncharacterized protein n=1 Tax=Bifidobacterium vansinderenii TaxID=1984871 RepID=A0A229W1D7_9BIFI|nr:hypothetical protein [Bifidobacterium vansinderenii]OXN01665.1 hypothetical protein Tam10B_0107 [Bifidobacterium vansinderenii]